MAPDKVGTIVIGLLLLAASGISGENDGQPMVYTIGANA